MKNLSKVLAVVLALAMMFSMVGTAAFTDVTVDASYSEAVSILNSLSIIKGYEDGSFKPEATITREEFAAVVCRILGLGETAEGAIGQTSFTDVPADSWSSGYIALAAQQKIINGKGDGLFDPSAPVKYEEAIKMIVAALGYTPMAEVNGGYPGGYQVVAAQKGILSNVKGGKAGEAATRAIVAQMCYNSLEVPLMVQKGFGTDVKFETGDQLLLNKLSITKFEGTVTATNISDTAIKAGKIKLEYKTQISAVDGQSSALRLSPNDARCNPFVGASTDGKGSVTATVEVDEAVDAVAKELLNFASVMYVADADTDEAKLIAIAKKGTKNTEVTFAAEDINDTKTNAASGKKVYVNIDKTSDKYETYNLADEMTVFVNGRSESYDKDTLIDYLKSDIEAAMISMPGSKPSIKIDGADIKLLSNGLAQDEYNVAYITSTKSFVVKDKVESKFVLDLDGTRLVLDEEDDNARFEIFKAGAKITYADIAINDVVSISGSIDSNSCLEYGSVTVTSEQVKGKIGSYQEEDRLVTVDGKEYKVYQSIIDDIANKSLRLGDEATFYVDARGVLTGVDREQTSTNLKYGFATKFAESTTSMDASFQVRMYNTEGVWQTINLASKVRFNDGDVQSLNNLKMTDVFSKTGGAYEENSTTTVILNKVIGYEVNEQNLITKIYFIPDNKPNSIFSNETANSSYDENTGMIGGVTLEESTFVFSTDATPASTKAVDEDTVSIAKRDSLSDRTNYTITAYNVDEDTGVPKVIAGVALVGKVKLYNDFMVVASKATKNNEQNDQGVAFTGNVLNDTASIFAKDDVIVKKMAYKDATASDAGKPYGDTATKTATLADIQVGDIIIYSKTGSGEAKEIVIVAQVEDIMAATPSATISFDPNKAIFANTTTVLNRFDKSGTDYSYVAGFVKKRDSKRITLVNDINKSASSEEIYTVMDGASTSTYDHFKTKNKVVAGSASDVTGVTTPAIGSAVSSGDGDFIVARVKGSRIEDMLVYKAYSTR